MATWMRRHGGGGVVVGGVKDFLLQRRVCWAELCSERERARVCDGQVTCPGDPAPLLMTAGLDSWVRLKKLRFCEIFNFTTKPGD